MSANRLTGAAALVVEDDAILAWAHESMLYAAGCASVKVVATVEEALRESHRHRPDLAVLDLRLRGGELSLPVADDLEDAGVPFMFLTGQDRAMIPERHRSRPYLAKPASKDAMVEVLESTLDAAACDIESRRGDRRRRSKRAGRRGGVRPRHRPGAEG